MTHQLYVLELSFKFFHVSQNRRCGFSTDAACHIRDRFPKPASQPPALSDSVPHSPHPCRPSSLDFSSRLSVSPPFLQPPLILMLQNSHLNGNVAWPLHLHGRNRTVHLPHHLGLLAKEKRGFPPPSEIESPRQHGNLTTITCKIHWPQEF